MKIGIDIDDTIVDTYEPMIKYANMYDIEVLGRTGSNNKLGTINHAFYLEELYGWDRKTKFDYFNKYYKIILEEAKMLANAAEIIRKLASEGNEIYFITARFDQIKDCDSKGITRKMLIDNDIPFNKLIFNADDKVQYCIDHGIKAFIDDSYQTCKKIQEGGIKSYLMTTKVNEKVDSLDIERVNNWKELYEKINKFKLKLESDLMEIR